MHFPCHGDEDLSTVLSGVSWIHLPFEIKSSSPALVVIVSNLLFNLVYVVLSFKFFFVCLFELFYNSD